MSQVYQPSQYSTLLKHLEVWRTKDYAIEVKRHDPKRSGSQQGLLHSLMREIAGQAGCGEEYFKQEVIKRNAADVFPHWPHDMQPDLKGVLQLVPKSESKLTKREESEMIERLYAFAVEWGYEVKAA